MARSGNMDPLTRYNFIVTIEYEKNPGYFHKLAFQSVTPPRVDINVDEYREGGRHLNPHQITMGATFSPVTLRRGKSYSDDFAKWMGAVFLGIYADKKTSVKGASKKFSDMNVGESANYRANVYIDHLDRRGRVVKKYILINARPTGYIPASNFNAEDDTQISIETLTIGYEGFKEFSLDKKFLAGILGEAGAYVAEYLTKGSSEALQPGAYDPSEK
jgi:phage tail-like protein